MHSSYTVNNYADVFKAIVSAFQPTVCVELGVLEGYSAIAIAKGLKENFDKHGTKGHLDAYDLFEEYPYRHVSMEMTLGNIANVGLSEWVNLKKADAFEVHERYPEHSVSFLHVDISNTGETIRKIMELWDNRMVFGGIICFEGGSDERDRIKWMKKYDALPLKYEFETNPVIETRYVFATYFKFPGLTCLLKKR